ncbi:MAG TPA: LysE family transporter [Devosia sp.]|nr:LysE family transporter [Devosia sp.]
MTDPVLFLLAVLTILGTPGPTNTLLAASGALAGVRPSLPLLIGELTGYLIAIAAIRIALEPVLAAYPVVGTVLKVLVAIYLGWLALRLWMRGGDVTAGREAVAVRAVLVTTLLNPKSLIFALAVLPPTATPGFWLYATAFAVSVAACGFGWILVGRVLGAAAGERHARLIPRAASVILAGFAAFILTSAFR